MVQGSALPNDSRDAQANIGGGHGRRLFYEFNVRKPSECSTECVTAKVTQTGARSIYNICSTRVASRREAPEPRWRREPPLFKRTPQLFDKLTFFSWICERLGSTSANPSEAGRPRPLLAVPRHHQTMDEKNEESTANRSVGWCVGQS